MQDHLEKPDTASREEPCLVDTGRGFSVSYRNRFLYSKYAPERAVLSTIDSFVMLPGSLVLAFSPALWLGLPELLKKLPGSSFVLGIETDCLLHEFAENQLQKLKSSSENPAFSKVAMLPFAENEYLVNILSGMSKSRCESLPHISTFRRALPIDMSAGTQFDKEGYGKIAALAQNAIASFWKNRITLTKLGRLFSRNIFKNLPRLPESIPFGSLRGSVSRPIFVFGAGESLETTLKTIPTSLLERCFIIAVDAAAPALKAHSLKIHAVCALEGQLAIEKAYIGGSAKESLIIADMCSRERVTSHTQRAVTYFASKFTDAEFFNGMCKKDFFPPAIPSLGSVGLTAVYVALMLRESQNIPVFITGLDFSFSLGRTHAKNTPAHIARLCAMDRLNPAENYAAAFRMGAKEIKGKNNTSVFTDTALEGYSASFADFFSGTVNLYDAGEQGLPLSIQQISSEKLAAYLETLDSTAASAIRGQDLHFSETSPKEKAHKIHEIREYLEKEEKSLNRIKELLMFGKDVASCSCSVEEELHALIAPREYLFLHFPDGYKCTPSDISFLKRVRSQIDFFLKDIKNELKEMDADKRR